MPVFEVSARFRPRAAIHGDVRAVQQGPVEGTSAPWRMVFRARPGREFRMRLRPEEDAQAVFEPDLARTACPRQDPLHALAIDGDHVGRALRSVTSSPVACVVGSGRLALGTIDHATPSFGMEPGTATAHALAVLDILARAALAVGQADVVARADVAALAVVHLVPRTALAVGQANFVARADSQALAVVHVFRRTALAIGQANLVARADSQALAVVHVLRRAALAVGQANLVARTDSQALAVVHVLRRTALAIGQTDVVSRAGLHASAVMHVSFGAALAVGQADLAEAAAVS